MRLAEWMSFSAMTAEERVALANIKSAMASASLADAWPRWCMGEFSLFMALIALSNRWRACSVGNVGVLVVGTSTRNSSG